MSADSASDAVSARRDFPGSRPGGRSFDAGSLTDSACAVRIVSSCHRDSFAAQPSDSASACSSPVRIAASFLSSPSRGQRKSPAAGSPCLRLACRYSAETAPAGTCPDPRCRAGGGRHAIGSRLGPAGPGGRAGPSVRPLPAHRHVRELEAATHAGILRGSPLRAIGQAQIWTTASNISSSPLRAGGFGKGICDRIGYLVAGGSHAARVLPPIRERWLKG